MVHLAALSRRNSCRDCDSAAHSLKTIASATGISEFYLDQIFTPLKAAGFIRAARGKNGGYFLNKPCKDISAGDVLRALEGSLYPVECLAGEDGEERAECLCGSECGGCVTKGVWAKMYEGLSRAADAITLDALAEEYSEKNRETIELTGDDL
jgi:Rrf2 family protein